MAARQPSASARAADAYDAAHIARATSFTAHFRKGPFEKYTVPAATLAEARTAAAALNAEHGGFGRRAMVYAVTAEGLTFAVPDSYPA